MLSGIPRLIVIKKTFSYTDILSPFTDPILKVNNPTATIHHCVILRPVTSRKDDAFEDILG
jgi:hypothetical protein